MPTPFSTATHTHLAQFNVWCIDYPAMRRFYTEGLGFEEAGHNDEWLFCYYNFPSHQISLMGGATRPATSGWGRCPASPEDGDHWAPYVTVGVPDLDRFIEWARANGIALRTAEPVMYGTVPSIDARDPDGNTVAVSQFPPEGILAQPKPSAPSDDEPLDDDVVGA